MSAYDLAKSKRSVGPLYPVLLDARGRVIDGLHRREADPNWPSVTLEHIKTERERLVARIVANICRRDISLEERKTQIQELAKLLAQEGVERGRMVSKIAELTGLTDRYIRMLLPEEFKREYTVSVSESTPIKSEIISESEKGVTPIILEELSAGELTCPHCEKRIFVIHVKPTDEHKLVAGE